MLGGLADQALFFTPGHAPLAALLIVPPGLLICYISYRLAARQLRPSFALRPLESLELQRALLLYAMASKRIETDGERKKSRPRWWRALRLALGLGRETASQGDETEDLRIYLSDLRSTILRLRARPIKRYKSWAHTVSARSALGRSLACYLFVLMLVVGLFCAYQPILWAGGIDPGFKSYVLWQAVKGRLLLANWLTANVAVIAMPLLYAARRMALNRVNRAQISVLKEFAGAGAEQLIHERQSSADGAADEASREVAVQSNWSIVLGVSPSATVDEVKNAYKNLVKKNHPDRVNDMSPSFIKLAEAETKKLNVAYAEALGCLQQ